jgi:hypothetical protein
MKNYIYHGTRNLIALPGRVVQTFPSGLVRIDRTYACRAGDEEKFRRDFAVGNLLPLDDNAPAIDNAYIFPHVQETRSDDGFTRFKVSGYGRTSTRGTLVEINDRFIRQEVVIPSSTKTISIDPPAPERKETGTGGQVFLTPPSVLPGEAGFYIINLVTTFRYIITNIERTNFGSWDECKISWLLFITTQSTFTKDLSVSG